MNIIIKNKKGVKTVKYIYILLNLFIFFNLNFLYASSSLKSISLQLEWKHQFEFAGFYAAKEKGYYKDIGLDVELKEYNDNINITEEVVSGRSTFGISSSSLILEKLQKKPVVLLSSYFKQNALAFVTKPNIKTLNDLKGKKVMALNWELEHTSLGAMLKDANITKDDITLVAHNFKIDKFVNGDVDAMSIFLTSQPYELDQLGVKYNILNPATKGIYSYDVELFTSEDNVQNDPEMIQNFIKASNEGWRYAFAHKQEIVDLIYSKYTKRKTKKALLYEANKTEELFKRHIFKIGAIAPELIKLNTQMYTKLGLVNDNLNINHLLFDYIIKKQKENSTFTQEELNYINKKQTVTISMLHNFKPFSFIENNNHQGLSVDIIEKISKISGLNFDIKTSSWSKSLSDFKEKKVDMISGISYAKKREKFSLFTEPYYEIPTYLFGFKNDTTYQNIENLKGKRVGVNQDMFYIDTLKALGIKIVEYDGSNQKVKGLAFGEIDYFLANYTTGLKAINFQSATNIGVIDEFTSIKREDLRYGINKNNTILHSIIEKSLNKIKQNELEYLIDKWILKINENIHNINLTKEESIWLQKNPMVKVAVMNYWNHDGNGNTIHTDYLKLLNKYSNLNILPIRYNAWKEGYGEAISNNNTIHGIMNLAWSKEREEKYFLYTKAYIAEPSYLVVRKQNTNINNLQDLINKSVLSKEKSITDNIIKDISSDIKIVPVKSDDMMYKKLYNDINMDAFITYKKDDKLLKKYELKVVKTIYDKYSEASIGVRKKYPHLESIINKIYKLIPKDELFNLQNKIYNDTRLYKGQVVLKNKINLTIKQEKYLKEKKEIRFCADPNWLPFEQVKNGQVIGISADYSKIIKDKLEIPFKLIQTNSWTEAIEYAKERKCDILSFLAMETDDRKKYLNFTTSYVKIPLVLATKLDVTFITNFNTLKSKRIGIPKGYAFAEILKKRYPNLNIVEVDNIKIGLKKVKNGKLFGYIGTLASIGHMFQTQFTGELKIAGKFDENWELAIGVRNDDKMLLDILQKSIDSISEEQHRNILNKWIAIKYEKSIDYKFIWQLLFVVFVILMGVFYWIRGLNKLNKELRKAKLKAEEATKSKSNFLANMSHEIRTPMNAIIGMTYLMEKTNLNKQQYEYTQKINTSSDILLKLINDILDSSKIEAGKLTIEKTNFNLKTILTNIENIIDTNIHDKGLNFKIVYANNMPTNLYGDSLRLSQVLANLTSNAIKFTSEGEVELNIKQISSDKFRFCIIDTGIGLSDEQINKLFHSFTQADASITRKFSGTGLGLSISKQLVELMNGRIWVESKSGVGSKFFFEIELKPSTGNAQEYIQPFSKKTMTSKSKKIDNIKKESVSNEVIDKLFNELKLVVLKRRPILYKPIIEKLDNYRLNEKDALLYVLIVKLLKEYKFDVVSELLNEK